MSYNIWNNNISHEVSFWKSWIEKKGSRNPNSKKKEEFVFRLNSSSNLQNYINELFKRFFNLKSTVNILDVGAGPCTYLGKKSNDFFLKITATDAMANSYYKNNNYNPPIKTIQLQTEKLSEKFKKEQFDFVFCRNALDHHHDPMLSIKQMLYVLNKKGFILLEHRTNEAEIEKYVGLHQFNLCVKDNDFYIWNKKEEINISQYLKTNYNCNTEILTNIDNGIANYHFVLITKN